MLVGLNGVEMGWQCGPKGPELEELELEEVSSPVSWPGKLIIS